MMARTSSPQPQELPPLPSVGGTYVLTDGEWLAVQQTAQPGDAPLPEPAPMTTAQPED